MNTVFTSPDIYDDEPYEEDEDYTLDPAEDE